MARKYFGTDGVRGLVGEAPITPEFVMRLGYAAGKVLAKAQSDSVKPSTGEILTNSLYRPLLSKAAIENW